MILHGIYNNGKIKVLDKSLPNIKSKVEIIFQDEDEKIENIDELLLFSKLKIDTKKWKFNREEIYG